MSSSSPSALISTAQQHAATIRPRIGGFPVLAAVLHNAGVTRIEFTLPSGQATYLTTAGAAVQQGQPLVTGAYDVPDFDQAALIRALRIDQNGDSEFPEFLMNIWLAGVVRYVVDLTARTVDYRGAHGDSYVEEYPEAVLG